MLSTHRHPTSLVQQAKRLLPLALACALAALLLPSPAYGSVRSVCDTYAAAHEQANRIPPGLLQAVARAESGRWLAEDQATKPWPWTVTSGKDSFYLPSKDAAIAKVQELKASGRTNIDVGCMQINLHYHPKAFASLDEAFDPASNVAYGSKFLSELRLQTRSWGKATAFYHSQNRARGNAYRSKVYKFWRSMNKHRVLRGGDRAGARRPRCRRSAHLLPGPGQAPADLPPGLPALPPGCHPGLSRRCPPPRRLVAWPPHVV